MTKRKSYTDLFRRNNESQEDAAKRISNLLSDAADEREAEDAAKADDSGESSAKD